MLRGKEGENRIPKDKLFDRCTTPEVCECRAVGLVVQPYRGESREDWALVSGASNNLEVADSRLRGVNPGNKR